MPETVSKPVELALEGMTCASCAARIEKKLNKVEGVTATVNYATETATVHSAPNVELKTLISAVEGAGYKAHLRSPEGQQKSANYYWQLILALALGVPVIVLSMTNLWQPLHWTTFILATPVVFIAAWPIHRATLSALRHGSASMDSLITLGVFASYTWSLYVLLGHIGEVYLEVAVGVIIFILTGRFLEARAKARAGDALRALLNLGAKEVVILRDGEEITLPISGLKQGDLFVVRPGEKVATDGVVTEGTGSIDTSLLTGESLPVDVQEGSVVAGATINTSGRIVVRATAIGADTELGRIAALVTQAQAQKAPVQRLADRISSIFVPAVVVIAIGTYFSWIILNYTQSEAIRAAVSVLVIACPCALGLATPTALLVGTGRGAQLGVLIRGPQILESTRRINTIALDKTGTLTTGLMSVHNATIISDRLHTLQLIASLEHASEHPLARSIVAFAKREGATLLPLSDFESTAGHGVSGVVDGAIVLAGSPEAILRSVLEMPDRLEAAVQTARDLGHSAVVAAVNGKAVAVFDIGDEPKASSAAALKELEKLGLTPWLITGDSQAAAIETASLVGIPAENVFGGVRPEGKVDAIRSLQQKGFNVAMVGDGVNDAAALSQADLGLAMGTGTDAAIEAADITLVRPDLWAVVDSIRLSRRTLRVIKGNLFWAFGYNVIGIPIAASGLLNPMYAGAAMAFSSLFVVTNSLRLRSFQSASPKD
ncbi:MAG TPA: heavy metal translocating P-type ATPase [Candidatus Nanopelagicaceae bacterium]|nr:heavy metal translocating P-type ATPase [Candidatus Nanopelagicaceae bacterium]